AARDATRTAAGRVLRALVRGHGWNANKVCPERSPIARTVHITLVTCGNSAFTASMPVPSHARGYESFDGTVGRTAAESSPRWTSPPPAPAGAPNIVVVLVDDMGYSDIGPFGSEIETPT